MATLELSGVEKAFGDTKVIHGVDLSVADGEFTVFVGPSGCGKSTLLRLICGLEKVSAGEIRIDGQRVNDVPAADRGLAMVFQSYALYPHMTVRENMAFGLENIRTPKLEVERKVRDAAGLLRLGELLERRPTELSGGQRQRVAIGRAIVREPRIFLFDEPLSNLDAELRVSMRAEIVALHRRLRTTMIYVTHDQVEAMTMADRIVVLRAGRIEQTGAPLALYNAPRSRFVAGFIGSPQMNFVPVRLAGATAGGALVELPDGGTVRVEAIADRYATGSSLTLGIRPEHLANADSTQPSLGLVVEQVERLGGHSLVYGRMRGRDTRIAVALPGQASIDIGETFAVTPEPRHCHLFGDDGVALDRIERGPA
jgi:multiple sugar transport system ATP-binding protein